MRITNIPPVKAINPKEQVKAKEKDLPAEKAEVKNQPAAVYVRSDKIERMDRQDSGHIYDSVTIDELKRESEKAHSHLIRLVQEMLKRQGKSLANLAPDETVKVDETARQEAAAMIGPDGPYGVEAVSNRLVDFAKAVSGGDRSKAGALRSAIEQGFKEAEKILGGLPQISQDTYKRTMEKFDAWANGED